jgi:hypothetical protein
MDFEFVMTFKLDRRSADLTCSWSVLARPDAMTSSWPPESHRPAEL